MRSIPVPALAAVVLLIGLLVPPRAAGQESPDARQMMNLRLCPMPVVGMSPAAVERHLDDVRSMLQDDDAAHGARGPCFNPMVVRFVPADSARGLRLQPFRTPPLPRDRFRLRDSVPRFFPLPSDSIPFRLLPPASDPNG